MHTKLSQRIAKLAAGLVIAVNAGILAGVSAAALGTATAAHAVPGSITFPLNAAKSVIQSQSPLRWCFTSQANCHHDYNAADIFAPTGTTVVSPVAGTVTSTTTASSGVGSRVQIRDDQGDIWYLAHMHHSPGLQVSPGQRVNPGTTIGFVGTSAHAQGTQPHLHIDMLPPPNTSRPQCSDAACSGLPFYNLQPLLIAAYNLLDDPDAGSNLGAAGPSSLHADFNADGQDDIAVFNDMGNGGLRMFVQYGGQSSLQQVWDAPAWGYPITSMRFVAGHFGYTAGNDIAGFLDYGNGVLGVWVWPGNNLAGGGRMIYAPVWGVPITNSRLTVGDYNNDGWTDISMFTGMSGNGLRHHVIYGGQWNLGLQQVWDAPAWGYPITNMRLVP
jgi:murein DD-endopeptidase MepM/ murein hydrolase activator NlpD